jgi:ArsR family transcriptional regulator, arsenate/arsenite/antimonite-responsive transcriptional repressor
MQAYESGSSLVKAIAEPIRLQILDILSSGELCACAILSKLAISQPTLSHHMKALTESGWVVARKKATWMYYSINGGAVERTHQFLVKLTSNKAGTTIRDDCAACACCEPASADQNPPEINAIGE